jgi:hypothetical protein
MAATPTNGPLRTIEQTPTLADIFDKIQARIVRMDYAIASGPHIPGDRDSQIELNRAVLGRLNDLMAYIEAAESRTGVGAERPV